MKRNKYLLGFILCTALFFTGRDAMAQAVVCPALTANDATLTCVIPCATLTATPNENLASTTTYSVSAIAYTPFPYSGGATTTFTGALWSEATDDSYGDIIPLPIHFCFFGNNYTNILIGTNGNITFNTGLADAYDPYPISGPLPGSNCAATENCIMGVWTDTYVGAGPILYAVYGTYPCRQFVISWDSTDLYLPGSFCDGNTLTSQIVLYETTNVIDIYIHNRQPCAAWNTGLAICGIENASGSTFYCPPGENGTTFSATDLAWRFTPTGPTSGWTYNWTGPGGTTVGTDSSIVVCPGSTTVYTVTATSDACAGVTISATSTVTTGGSVVITPTSTNPTQCGACNGTITLSGLTAGLSDTVSYTIGGVAQPPVIAIVSPGGTITLSGLCAGAYSLAVKQGACLTLPVTVTLTNPPISMTGTSANNSYCGVCDGSITLNGLFASTAYVITFSLGGVAQPPVSATTNAAGSITLTGLCAGTYTNVIATVTSSAGACVTPPIGPFTITAPPPPALNLVSFVNPSQCGYCDGSITIKAITPFTTDTILYSFNGVAATAITTISHADSAITISGLCAGAYTGFTVKVGDCVYNVIGSATLTTIPIVAHFDTSIHFGCHGDTVNFTNSSTTTPGTSLYYIWRFGDGTSDTSTNPSHIYAQGTYTVTLIADNHACEDSMLMTLPLVHPLVASFIDTPNIICQDELITFTNTSTISGGYPGQFIWSFGTGATDTNKNTTYTFLHTGTYTIQLIATDWVPCSDTVSAIVQVDTISGINIRLSDTVICQGTYVTYTGLYASLGNTGNIWDFGDGSRIADMNPVVHGFNDAGTFTVTVTANYRACQDITTSRTVVVIPQPYINLGADTSICKGSESVILADNLNGNNPAASWMWSTGQTGSSIVVVAPGYYYATVNINNCYASDTVWVQNNCYMDIPNVFSPNGDGVNDYFFPRQFLTKGLTAFSMNIYNRWGQLIFTTTTLDGRGWDGKLNNVDQPEGVFVYVIDATFKDGQKEHHQGNVTLLR